MKTSMKTSEAIIVSVAILAAVILIVTDHAGWIIGLVLVAGLL